MLTSSHPDEHGNGVEDIISYCRTRRIRQRDSNKDDNHDNSMDAWRLREGNFFYESPPKNDDDDELFWNRAKKKKKNEIVLPILRRCSSSLGAYRPGHRCFIHSISRLAICIHVKKIFDKRIFVARLFIITLSRTLVIIHYYYWWIPFTLADLVWCFKIGYRISRSLNNLFLFYYGILSYNTEN